MSEPEVVVRLTASEAAVLWEFLCRFVDSDRLVIEDQAEQQALCNLQCVFEKTDKVTWPPLAQARARLRHE